nr:aspartate aminotransferase [uncultured bacterium]
MTLADRMQFFDSSGIRKVFDLAKSMTNPINLSIGQPDFDVPDIARQAAIEAIESRKSGYSSTQGIAPLLDKLQGRLQAEYGHTDRKPLITSALAAAWFWRCWRW